MLLFCKTFSITFSFFFLNQLATLSFSTTVTYCGSGLLFVIFLAQSSVSIVYIQGSAKYRTTLTNLIDKALPDVHINTAHSHL